MNQCVPNWDVEENHHPPPPHRLILRAHSNSSSLAPDVPTLDYEVTELTWENGQLAMHGLGPPRLANGKIPAAAGGPVKYTWEKQLPAGGTLESVVNQATIILPCRKPNVQQSGCLDGGGDHELVPWFEDHRRPPAAAASLGLAMDALVPCSNKSGNIDCEPGSLGTCVVGCSATHVGSCSAATAGDARFTRVSVATAGEQSVSCSATYGIDSRQVTVETCDREVVTAGFTSVSLGSPENTSSAAQQCTKTGDEHDSACQSRNERDAEDEKKKGHGKSSVSTKRSRAAAIHNQSERKRRDKINQKMKTLQKLVPNSSKTDKASMLDEVIEYLKQLQAQVNIMSRMNMPSMMLPLAMQQQLQMMSMMAPMGYGMNMAGVGLGVNVMDLNSIGRPAMAAAGMPHVLHPTTFMPAATAWDALGVGDRLHAAAAAASSSPAMPDPFAAFLACQSQPMTMEAYARMAALYQQFQQPPGPAQQNKFI